MTFTAERAAEDALTDTHKLTARRFWTPKDPAYALPASQSASGGHPGDAAVSDAPPPLADLRVARRRLRGHGSAVAGSAAVAPVQPLKSPVPPIPAVNPTFVSFAAERIKQGPWGPCCWVVSNVVTGHEVARYLAHETDGPGAILRALQEELCWRERQSEEVAG